MIHAILNGDLGHALETLLAVSILILVILMLRRAVSRQFGAGIVYLLWAIPVARFFLPPLPTPVSILNLELGALAPAAEPVVTSAVETTAAPHTAALAMPVQGGEWASPAAASEPGLLGTAASLTDDLLAIGLIAFIAAWAAGALFFAARSILAHVSFMQIVDREAMPVSARMQDLAVRIAAETGLKRPPRIVASLISRGPFVTGLFRPVVVMPAWFEDDYTPAEARAALAHEFMHVRRGDLWALQVSELFVAAMWFNPLAYIARNAFRTDQEAACDADVLARCQTSPHAYGSALVKAAKLHLPEPAYAAGRLPLTHALKERLTRMTYPAPSSRRRMIGFGAALLFGVSTLAITASVAAAAEPKDKQTKEIRIESNTLWIDGEAADRQIVMLSDPMAKVIPHPPMPPEVEELQRQIDADVAELTGPEMMGIYMNFAEGEDFAEITRMSAELALLGAELGALGASEAMRVNFEAMSEAEIEAWEQDFEARMEAKAAAIEARAAEMEKRIEKHTTKIDARTEAEIEKKMAVIERRIEANADRIEKIVEERFGPEFEARIEAQGKVIEDLVEACKTKKIADGETTIIERKDIDGEPVRVACVKGNRAALKSDKALAYVGNYPGITEAEKAKFRAAAKGERGKQVFVIRSGDTDVDFDFDLDVKTPAPPKAPRPTRAVGTPDTSEPEGE
jgi:beta-lactamase regulating signal transducer with metallopeptidase domain